MARVKRRLAKNITPEGEHVGFCSLAEIKNPPEAYFAVEGDEEKLAPEFQPQPPRRGAGGSWGEGGPFPSMAETSFEGEYMGVVAERETIVDGSSRPTLLSGSNGSDEPECGSQGSGSRCREKLGKMGANDVSQPRSGIERREVFADLPSEPSATSVSHREERLGESGGVRIDIDGFRDTDAYVTGQPNEGDDRRWREGR